MEDPENKIQTALSVEKTFAHLLFLVNRVGEKIAGTRQIRRAKRYIAGQMNLWGYAAKLSDYKQKTEEKLKPMVPMPSVCIAWEWQVLPKAIGRI